VRYIECAEAGFVCNI